MDSYERKKLRENLKTGRRILKMLVKGDQQEEFKGKERQIMKNYGKQDGGRS